MTPQRRSRRGTAAVELALTAPLLILLLTGTGQFGWTFYLYGELEQAVRDGTRYASVQNYDSTDATLAPRVKNAVVYGTAAATVASGTAPIIAGLTTDKVSVTYNVPHDITQAATVTVAIDGYSFPSLFGASLTLHNKPQLTLPYVGVVTNNP